jgi:dTMP kinase
MSAGPSTSQRQRGTLIVVEGLDRAGKSSQCEILNNNLSSIGHNVNYIRFPGTVLLFMASLFFRFFPTIWLMEYTDRSTPIGKMIDSYLRGIFQLDDHSIHLLFSANRWEVAKSIEDDVNNGVTVIVDRYSYSGAVYSAAKGNPNLSLEWAWLPEVGLPRPDLCLFLNISTEEAARRGGFGIERYETNSMQQRVRQLFLSLVSLPHNDEFAVIDAGKSVEEVAQDVLEVTLRSTGSPKTIGPLRKFGPNNFISTGLST